MNALPGQTIYVSYIIPNPSDVATYYPQAVVKNTKTGAIVATINLTQDATQILRYTGSFVSPADSIGYGYFLDVVTIPYTDSAHTTPSQNYGAAWNQYFVYQSPGQYGGGEVALIDYKQIQELVKGELKGLKLPEMKIPEGHFKQEKVDLVPIVDSINSLQEVLKKHGETIASIPKPEKVEIDFSSVEKLSDRLDSFNVDMKPLQKEFLAFSKAIMSAMESNGNSISSEHKKVNEELLNKITECLDYMMETGIPMSFRIQEPAKKTGKVSKTNVFQELLKAK